jgi:murein DD-endopeptidase MepM/ murein hydrolase activator NlpD
MKEILTTSLFALLTATMFGMSYQPNPGDSVESEGHTCNHFEDIFPAENIYGQWDTDVVHYYGQQTIEQFANTRLVLAHNSNCDFFFPVPNGRITSKFGPRGRKGRMHKGIDIDLETGDPVYSAFEGKVRYAAYNDSYGNCVVVRHPNGLETYYAHLDKLGVASGDYVQAGDYLGTGGNTGRSRGSHLHFEVRFLGVPIDPLSIIKEGEYKLALESLVINSKSEKVAVIRTGEKYHTVQPGDDLQSIAEKYCVSVASLIELNSISENTMLLIDSKIRFQ